MTTPPGVPNWFALQNSNKYQKQDSALPTLSPIYPSTHLPYNTIHAANCMELSLGTYLRLSLLILVSLLKDPAIAIPPSTPRLFELPRPRIRHAYGTWYMLHIGQTLVLDKLYRHRHRLCLTKTTNRTDDLQVSIGIITPAVCFTWGPVPLGEPACSKQRLWLCLQDIQEHLHCQNTECRIIAKEL